MTGRPVKQMLICWSPTSDTGKSTWLAGVAHVFGDYGWKVHQSLLVPRGSGSSHQSTLLELAGRRWVYLDEQDSDGELEVDTTLLKELTAGEGSRVVGRQAHAGVSTTFPLTSQLAWGMQSLPVMTAEQAVKRRLATVRFTGQFKQAGGNFDRTAFYEDHADELLAMLVAGHQQVADADNREAAFGWSARDKQEALEHWEATDWVNEFLEFSGLTITENPDHRVSSAGLKALWEAYPDRPHGKSYQHGLLPKLRERGTETAKGSGGQRFVSGLIHDSDWGTD